MSLHVELSPEAVERLRIQRRNSTVSSFLISILCLVLVGLTLGFFLLKPDVEVGADFISYPTVTRKEPEPDPPKIPLLLQSKPTPPSFHKVRVIAPNAASSVSIPVPEEAAYEPSLDFGSGNDFGSGIGDWNGNGSGGGNGGDFGSSDASSGGLKGFMYDLKQDAKKQPLPYTPETFISSMAKIQKGRFSDSALSDYFRSPDPLYLTRLAIPWTDASQGPKLFKVDQYIQPRGWFAHYRGTVIAPKSGKFRFVGLGDDYIMVSISGKPVLHASLSGLQEGVAQGWKGSETPKFAAPFTVPSQRRLLQSGDWINLRAGQEIELDIAIGERPGGQVWFILLVEEKGEKYEKAASGRPILPIFTTAPFSEEEVTELTKQFSSERFGDFQFEFDPEKVPVFRLKK